MLVGTYVERDPSIELPEIHRELALWLGRRAESNRETLNRKLKAFTWGLSFLVLEIVGVVIVIGDATYG